jgi:hypothetical protein
MEKLKIKEFNKFLDEIGVSNKQGGELVKEMFKVRKKFNTFKNSLLQGGNINAANKEFMDIMSSRWKYKCCQQRIYGHYVGKNEKHIYFRI